MTEPTVSTPFADMAARIDHNRPEDFAGALVIVPPSGDPMTVLLLDGSKDTGSFWAMAKVKIESVWKTLQDQERQRQGGWNR